MFLISVRSCLDIGVHLRSMVGSSPELLALLDKIGRVAGVPRPLLIVGERGTGKELVARAIHEASGDADRPFVALNCAAFTGAPLERKPFSGTRRVPSPARTAAAATSSRGASPVLHC